MNDGWHRTVGLTRRAALAALGAAGAGAVLWPSRSRARAPRGRVEVRYWEKWTGREGAAVQAIVNRYNASQDRAWVRLVPVSEIASKAMVAIGGGDPPDVVGLYTYNVPGYAEARAVMPLDELAPLDARLGEPPLEASHYAPGVAALLSHEGRLWAGVNTCYTLALYYNRAMLTEAGVAPPRTIGELDEAAERLTVRGVGGSIERAGFLPNLPPWWPYVWPFLFGGALYDAERDRATIASREGIAAMEWVGRTAERVGRAAGRAFAGAFGRSMHSAGDPFITGRVAMIVQGPWMANFIAAYRPGLAYSCVAAPEAGGADEDRPAGLLEADVLMIPRGARHAEEAYAFVRYMQRREVQEALCRMHHKPSPLAEVSPGFIEGHPSPCIGVHERIAKSPRANILPRTRVWKAYADLIASAFDAVWSGAEAGPALRRVEARAQALLDREAARRAARRREEARA
jgi:ABC-type glycerol-3-phosphate transport system substrate-binding protein